MNILCTFHTYPYLATVHINSTDNIRTNRNWKKTTVWIFQATNKQNLTRDHLDMAKKEITEFLQTAAQNNAIRTNNVIAKIKYTLLNTKYRLYNDRDETINHIINEHSKLAQKEYKSRYDCVGKGNPVGIVQEI